MKNTNNTTTTATIEKEQQIIFVKDGQNVNAYDNLTMKSFKGIKDFKGFDIAFNSMHYRLIKQAMVENLEKTVLDTKSTVRKVSELLAFQMDKATDYSYKISRNDFENVRQFDNRAEWVLFSSYKAAIRFGYMKVASQYKDVKRVMGIFYNVPTEYTIFWQRYNVTDEKSGKTKERYNYYLIDNKGKLVMDLPQSTKAAKQAAIEYLRKMGKLK